MYILQCNYMYYIFSYIHMYMYWFVNGIFKDFDGFVNGQQRLKQRKTSGKICPTRKKQTKILKLKRK